MTPRELGARLAAARHAAGLSQRQVADKLGVHHPTIVWIEQGTRKLSLLEAVQLADIYGIDITALLETAAPFRGTPRGPDAPPLQSTNAATPTQ